MKRAVLFAVCLLAFAEPPPAILELLRVATEDLANRDANAFLSHFAPETPGLATIRQQVSALIAVDGAASTTTVAQDEGDDQTRRLQIDWLLRVGASRRKRTTVTVTLERRGNNWKFTGFDPVDFFSLP